MVTPKSIATIALALARCCSTPGTALAQRSGSKGTATPMANERDQHPTIQDDRAALELDAEAASPLVHGEGAPLAEDGVADKPHGTDLLVPRAMMGGAPLGAVVPTEGHSAPHDPIAARDNEPIDD